MLVLYQHLMMFLLLRVCIHTLKKIEFKSKLDGSCTLQCSSTPCQSLTMVLQTDSITWIFVGYHAWLRPAIWDWKGSDQFLLR